MIIFLTDENECTSDKYSTLYEAAHNNDMTAAIRYVEEYECCPTVAGSSYGNSALSIAQQRNSTAIVAYFLSIDCDAIGSGKYLWMYHREKLDIKYYLE